MLALNSTNIYVCTEFHFVSSYKDISIKTNLNENKLGRAYFKWGRKGRGGGEIFNYAPLWGPRVF